MRRLKLKINKLADTEGGSILIESLVAIVALSVLATSVLGGLSTTHISGIRTERQSVAENVARRQMAAVVLDSYVVAPTTYTSVSTPAGYTVTAVATEEIVADTTIQRITVTVFFDGAQVLVLESTKGNF